MITIIHGDDTTASRNYYFEQKSKAKDSIILDGAKVTVTELAQALEGDDLFGSAKQIFIEELFSKRKASKELDALLAAISQTTHTATLWESKELTAKQTSAFKNATIKTFKIPATIFALLDALKPNNSKQLIELFHKTLGDKDAEFVFFMLQRQVRILLALSSVIPAKAGIQKNKDIESGMTSTISELSRIATWQKGKLEKQASLFSPEQLLSFHSQLFEIEYGLKTGNLSLPLPQTIDLLLLNI